MPIDRKPTVPFYKLISSKTHQVLKDLFYREDGAVISFKTPEDHIDEINKEMASNKDIKERLD